MNIELASIIPTGIYETTWSEAERLVFLRKERVPIDVWAERNRMVETGPRKGRWRNSTTPYLVGPMRALSDPNIRKVICMFAPQTGKTQIAFNFLGHAADLDPGPAMYVMPDEKVARRILRRRLLPMFRETPAIARLLSDDERRDITALAVYFRNGMSVLMAWATSAAELASEPIRYLILDEVDKYPEFSGKEADPIALAEMRTNAFPHTKKILEISTPTSDEGYINQAMEKEADEIRKFHVPCPKCGTEQVMTFENIISLDPKEKDPRAIVRKRLARYKCADCGKLWDDATRDRAVRKGVWRAEKPVEAPVTVGFHLPSWYSPFVSLSSVVAAFRRGLDQPGKLYIFKTQHEAVPWEEHYTPRKEEEILKNKCDLPSGVVPKDAIALTCGIDMQKHGFWFVVKAWDKDLTSWLVQYGFLSGWKDLEALVFDTHFPVDGSDRKMQIFRAALDTGGGESSDGDWSRTEEAYTWLRKNSRGVVFGIKGASRPQLRRVEVKIIDKMKRGNRLIPGGLELRFLDTAQFKDILHWRLAREEGQTQKFYLHKDTGIDYARHILAEEKRRDIRGRFHWKQVRHDNHLLDATVYADACADPQWTPSIQYIQKARGVLKVRGKRRVISRGIGSR